MGECGGYILVFALFTDEIWAGKWRNIKRHERHDGHIKFLRMRACDRYLSQFDSFEQTLDSQLNHISDHGFKFISGSVTSTDKSKCVANFRFACVLK